MKLFIGIPAYDGKLCIETVRALLNEQGAAALLGHELQFGLLPGCSLITHARNQIVRDFLASDADRLVFVDTDVSWNAGELLKIAAHPVDFVGGAYRFKETGENYPVHWLDKPELWADPDTGLLEVKLLPAGFLALSRDVFSRFKEAFPDRGYKHGPDVFHAYFYCPPGDGEDGTFCREWRELGGQVWLDPELTLTHTGGNPSFTGNIGKWLRGRE